MVDQGFRAGAADRGAVVQRLIEGGRQRGALLDPFSRFPCVST